MQWNDIGEFLAMGGRAFYVWGSFGACLLLMVAEPILAQRRARAVRDTLRRERLADELDRKPG
ncbi:MAG: heme exporter protein CcmD [Burkholderiales bacterium]|jgi:heme exporter protein D|nr:heme exporter protein CcmD [Burkholderiales bacterium]MBP7519429.1 heme exporter protein CcmD [Leptothrix sp. (in: b-proteobacteria)]HQY09671.1 heme exporter protein CcmD [Burkholderiaceae bacterium]